MEYISRSSDDTRKIACDIARSARKGDVFCLSGDLGAGKTEFAKGFAMGLGITLPVTSPTFTIINEYSGGTLPLYHFDVYRINSVYEMEDTGYEDYFYGDGICLIEWAELISEILPENALKITIDRDYENEECFRSITVEENSL